MVSIPGLDIEVAQECSSIRSSLLLVVTTMVFAHLFLRSWWRKALLIAVAIPLSVAKNGLRIFTIAELGTRVDPSFLTGRLHHQGGIVFFGVSVMAMGAVLWALRSTEPPLPRNS
jgi:exosortase/archaeosortase family protein